MRAPGRAGKLARRLSLPLLLAAAPLAALDWRVAFFHDEDDSGLAIHDLKFFSARDGVAVGVRRDGERNRPVAVITRDGGRNWSYRFLKELPRSMFVLDEKTGWLACEDGVWRTRDAGESWSRLARLGGVFRLYFLSAERGWAVGAPKAVWETRDGGVKWTKVGAADEPKSRPAYTAYTWIEALPPRLLMIAGSSRPPRSQRARLPAWIDPEEAARRREWPELSLTLESRDGGETWKSSTSSLFGQITRLRLGRGGLGMALIEFFDSFEWPAEVHRIDLRSGKSERVFRQKDRAVTDIGIGSGGEGYLAAIEPPGPLRGLPIPGKLKILRSLDLREWAPMEVDYRASGTRAMLAGSPDGGWWAATDTGMILKLEPGAHQTP